jgi:hypothetical protein
VAFITVPSGAGDGDWAGEPGIRQDRRIDHGFDRVIDARQQRRVDHVDPGAHLRRALEMQPHRAALDCDLDRHWKGALQLGIVVRVGKAVGAVRQCRDPGAHLALGIILQGVADGEHRLGAVFAAQRLRALHAQPVRRHLRPQIRQPLARDLAVEQDQLLHVGLQFPGPIEADRRDAQTFLVDVGVAAIGKIGVVRGVDRPGDDAPVDENWLAEHDVG